MANGQTFSAALAAWFLIPEGAALRDEIASLRWLWSGRYSAAKP